MLIFWDRSYDSFHIFKLYLFMIHSELIQYSKSSQQCEHQGLAIQDVVLHETQPLRIPCIPGGLETSDHAFGSQDPRIREAWISWFRLSTFKKKKQANTCLSSLQHIYIYIDYLHMSPAMKIPKSVNIHASPAMKIPKSVNIHTSPAMKIPKRMLRPGAN